MHDYFSILSVMTPFPYSIGPEAHIQEARALMRQYKIRHLPVSQGGEVIGLVSDHDIKLMLGPEFGYPKESELKVDDVYVDEPYVVDISTPLLDVLNTLVARHIGSAVVTKHNKLAGIVTARDVCAALASFLESKKPPSPDEVA